MDRIYRRCSRHPACFGVLTGLGYVVSVGAFGICHPIATLSVFLGAIQFWLLDLRLRKRRQPVDDTQSRPSPSRNCRSLSASTRLRSDRAGPLGVRRDELFRTAPTNAAMEAILLVDTRSDLRVWKHSAHWLTGLLVLAMVGIDGTERSRGHYDESTKANKQSVRETWQSNLHPVLAIPIVTFSFAIAFRVLRLDANRGALVGLGFGVSPHRHCLWISGQMRVMMQEGRRLNMNGWVNILPQLLASLESSSPGEGGRFDCAGASTHHTADNLFLLVLANCLGMALFTL